MCTHGLLSNTDAVFAPNRRSIYIGSARDGWVTAFIPDPEPDPDNAGTTGAEGVAVDAGGNIYGAEVGPTQEFKYRRR